jgi:hypothetical protein
MLQNEMYNAVKGNRTFLQRLTKITLFNVFQFYEKFLLIAINKRT